MPLLRVSRRGPPRVVLAAVLAMAGAGCSHDAAVAGTYELDAATFRDAMLATVPTAIRSDAAELQRIEAMLQQSRVTITLAADGGVVIVARGASGESTETGTWQRDGDTLTLTTRDEAQKQMVRRAQWTASALTIDDEMVPGKPVRMTFGKQ